MQSLSVWSKGTSWAHRHHLASLWKPVSLFEDPPNKKHKAKHRCSWNVAPLILALSRKLMLCWMALRKRLLEAWLALKPPQVSAWGSSISAASLSPVQTFLFRGQEAFSNYTSWKTSAVCPFFFLFKPSLFVSFFCSSFSLLLHYAPISSPFLRHIHAESLYLSTLCLWRHCTAFLNTFPMVSHRGCCLDVTRTNLPVFSDPWVRGKAHQSKRGTRCLVNGSLLKPVLS